MEDADGDARREAGVGHAAQIDEAGVAEHAVERVEDEEGHHVEHHAEANAQLCLDMDADIRAWIKNVMEAHAQYTQDLKTHSEETAATSDDDPAKALRKTIGRYNSLLVLLQGVIELDAQFKDAIFIDFWQRYCNIYRSIFEQKDSIGSIHTTFDGEIGLLVSDEVEIEEPQESGEEIENADDVPIFKKRDSE